MPDRSILRNLDKENRGGQNSHRIVVSAKKMNDSVKLICFRGSVQRILYDNIVSVVSVPIVTSVGRVTISGLRTEYLSDFPLKLGFGTS